MPEGYISSEETKDNKLARFNIPDQTIWERLATINTTINYERSFQLLREGVNELAIEKQIPPLLMLKKVIYNHKVTQVWYLLNCK